ncbi:MAG TPA: family 1 glycosylhydrolase [Propionibacteriaceae bacterium]|nr:family 1 glycosylhydrolase [Propionibacteriaceae bacterium]
MVVFTALGDRVDRWLTINEAKIIAQQGYQYGRMAPGKINSHAAGVVIHHLNLAHGRAVTAFRTAKAKGRIGPDTLTRTRREYGSPEVMITENGVPDSDGDSGQPTVDHARVEFLKQHLRALHQAITDGCRVIGYHAWSLLDNFEWAAGYSQRWGLVRVDFDTFQRIIKGSASWYSTVAEGNQLPRK